MSNDLAAVCDGLRQLEKRMLAVSTKVEGDPAYVSVRDIAISIGLFAEMIPIYGSFVDLLERSAPQN